MRTDTKTKHKTYQIEQINETLLNHIFNYKTNDVWGVEFNGRELFLIAPPYFKIQEDLLKIKPIALPKQSYSIQLKSPSFMPLFSEEPIQLFSQLKNKDIFIQLLFKKATNKQMLNFVEQYENYLNGINLTVYNRFFRKSQKKIMQFLEQFIDIEQRERIQDFEDKMLANCYFFNIRLFYDHDINVLEEIFDQLNYYNSFKIEYAPNIRHSTINRIFDNSYHQILSEQEIKLLLLNSPIDLKENKDHSYTIEIVAPSKSAIHLLPTRKKIERQIDEELIHQIPYALQKAKVIKDHKIEMVNVELGATVQRITFKIPKGLTYTEIKKRYEDIKAALGMDLSIIQGNEPNTITFLIPCRVRDIIYLKDLLEHPELIRFAEENPLPFVCGIDMMNQLAIKCLTKAPHLLVAGATNSGKSVFINTLLVTLILLRTPMDLKLILIDPKKVEFTQYQGIPHIEKVVTKMEESIDILHNLVNEMEKRYDLISKYGVKNIAGYNKHSKSKLPYIVCAIDEYNDLRMQYPDVEGYIERLGQKARAAGIHLILCTQRPDKDVMSGVIKTNLPSRISFRLDNSNEYKTVFGTGVPFNLLGFGDGVVKYIAQTEEFIRFQAPIITLDEEEEMKFFEHLKKHLKGEFVSHEDIIEEPPINKLKRIIALTKETRIKELQQKMGIRINDVSDLMKQLVHEGWLEKETKGYKIIASEEELNKWRGE